MYKVYNVIVFYVLIIKYIEEKYFIQEKSWECSFRQNLEYVMYMNSNQLTSHRKRLRKEHTYYLR